jgi:hypothetical protein
MAMTTRGTRGKNQLMEWAEKFSTSESTKKQESKKSLPLFPKTKMKNGETYRLPQKRGSRGKGTYKG